MIALVDYGAGNIRSMREALNRAGAEYEVTDSVSAIQRADRVIIPGVGEAASAMHEIRERGLADIIPSLTVPVLGVCIGMQVLCRHSEEGETDCLGIIPCDVRKLTPNSAEPKIPHIGWNTLYRLEGPLFEGIADDSWVYYVHSYAADICDSTVAVTRYTRSFSAALQKDNFFGVQFHPEKSASAGAKIISNFLSVTSF